MNEVSLALRNVSFSSPLSLRTVSAPATQRVRTCLSYAPCDLGCLNGLPDLTWTH